MSTERRRQAREAFARLAELPEEQRAAELRRLGAADERLRADVEALLHAESILGVEGVAETDAGGQAAESEAGPTASTPAASQEPTRDANSLYSLPPPASYHQAFIWRWFRPNGMQVPNAQAASLPK